MSRVWSESSVKGNELLMLLAIADFADDNGVAYPSVATLAKKSRVTERPAHRTIANLIERGHLTVELNAGPRGTNVYRVLFPDENGVASTPGCNISGVASTTGGGGVDVQKGVASVAPEPSIEPSIEPSLFRRPSPSPPSSAPKTKARTANAIPDRIDLNDKDYEFARSKGVSESQADDIAERMIDWVRSDPKQRGYKDWKAAWRNWVRKDARDNTSVPGRRTAGANEALEGSLPSRNEEYEPTEWGPMLHTVGRWQTHIPPPPTPLSGIALLRYYQANGFWFIPGRDERVYFSDLPGDWLDELEERDREWSSRNDQ